MMITTKNSLLAFSATAISLWAQNGFAQDSNEETQVVTANRFEQPVSSVLAPTTVVTKEQIDEGLAIISEAISIADETIHNS